MPNISELYLLDCVILANIKSKTIANINEGKKKIDITLL